MKKSVFIFGLVSIFLLVLGIGFATFIFSQTDDGKLKISNETNERIAVFYDRISKQYYLGDISVSEANTFSLPENKPYTIMAILYSEYQRLSELKGKISPSFYELVYYDDKSEIKNMTIAKIDKAYTENANNMGKMSFINLTDYWVELHSGHSKGNLLAIVSPKFNTTINLKPQGYDIFPVYYLPIYDISSSESLRKEKSAISYTKQIMKSNINTIRIDEGQIFRFVLDGDVELTSDIAYMSITNHTNTGFRVVNAVALMKTGTDKSILNPDETLLYWLDKNRTYKQLHLATSGTGGKTYKIPAIKTKENRVYEVKISSEYEVTVKDEDGVSLNDFLNRID